jgi:hypothetical protein
MDDFLKQLDVWLKPVNEAVFSRIQPAQLIRYLAILMLVGGVLSVLGGLNLLSASAALAALGLGSYTFWAILSLISGALLIVGGYGLFQRQPWGRMAAVWAAVAAVVINLLGIFLGGGIVLTIIFILLYGYIAYLFYHHSAIKQELGG